MDIKTIDTLLDVFKRCEKIETAEAEAVTTNEEKVSLVLKTIKSLLVCDHSDSICAWTGCIQLIPENPSNFCYRTSYCSKCLIYYCPEHLEAHNITKCCMCGRICCSDKKHSTIQNGEQFSTDVYLDEEPTTYVTWIDQNNKRYCIQCFNKPKTT